MVAEQVFEILVVDDDPAVFDLFQRIGQQTFSEASFRWLASPQQILQNVKQQLTTMPRLILLDIDFQQGIDGLMLLPQLYAYYKGQVPIIMLTATDNPLAVQQAYSDGAVAFTQKPESLQQWKDYIHVLKQYWYQTITLPDRETPKFG